MKPGVGYWKAGIDKTAWELDVCSTRIVVSGKRVSSQFGKGGRPGQNKTMKRK